jgi:hypothetical protein
MSAVDLLSGAELQRAADAAGQVADAPLVGGQNGVWISTTLIIAILVIVIIVVAVAD